MLYASSVPSIHDTCIKLLPLYTANNLGDNIMHRLLECTQFAVKPDGYSQFLDWNRQGDRRITLLILMSKDDGIFLYYLNIDRSLKEDKTTDVRNLRVNCWMGIMGSTVTSGNVPRMLCN